MWPYYEPYNVTVSTKLRESLENFPEFSVSATIFLEISFIFQIFQIFPRFSRFSSRAVNPVIYYCIHVTRTRPSNRKELKKWFIPSNKIMLKTYHWVKIKHLNEHTNYYKVKKFYGILRTFQFRSWEQWITVQSQK